MATNPYESPGVVEEEGPRRTTSSEVPAWLRVTAFSLVAVPTVTICSLLAPIYGSASPNDSVSRELYNEAVLVGASCVAVAFAAFFAVYRGYRPLTLGIGILCSLLAIISFIVFDPIVAIYLLIVAWSYFSIYIRQLDKC